MYLPQFDETCSFDLERTYLTQRVSAYVFDLRLKLYETVNSSSKLETIDGN